MIKVQPGIEIISNNSYDEMVKKIELIGRVCYKSEDNMTDDSAYTFIGNIIKRGHESVIEHETISIRVICDRGVTHEIVRHRIASYSQESTRYCNYSKDKFQNQISVIDISTGFNYDLNDKTDLEKYNVWEEAMMAAEKYYFHLLELGATPQEARSVLPNSLKSEIVITMNLRSWRNFLRLRTSKAAHPQIREIADEILQKFSSEFPVFFSDLYL